MTTLKVVWALFTNLANPCYREATVHRYIPGGRDTLPKAAIVMKHAAFVAERSQSLMM